MKVGRAELSSPGGVIGRGDVQTPHSQPLCELEACVITPTFCRETVGPMLTVVHRSVECGARAARVACAHDGSKLLRETLVPPPSIAHPIP